jgi:hypothetical protein
MKRAMITIALGATLLMGAASMTSAQCPPDAILAGTVCMDKYEASVWRVPDPIGANAGLVNRIKEGTVTAADLAAGGATPLGLTLDDYAPCNDDGQNCGNDIYAVSLAGVIPSASITWFQAQEACANSGKRLPTSAEWQVAANGTPDTGGTDNGTTDCNTDFLVPGVTATGFRSGCVSARGAYDMVGNLEEWVADWVPLSTNCSTWGAISDDLMCLSGASSSANGPGALRRGGDFNDVTEAGPFKVDGRFAPSETRAFLGFRCARPVCCTLVQTTRAAPVVWLPGVVGVVLLVGLWGIYRMRSGSRESS